jgi:hypothetical protein
MKYLVSSFVTIVLTVIYLFTVFNSRVLGEFGNLQSLTPVIVVLVLGIGSIVFSIIGWRNGGNKIVSAVLLFFVLISIALLTAGALAQGFH